MKHIILTALLFLLTLSSTLTGRTIQRNLLTSRCDQETLRTVLIQKQNWVKYPHYSEREKWDALLGKNKQDLISQGEDYLNYTWQVIRASDYLDYRRTGIRVSMENPNNANLRAINTLLLAELAEGKGRFIDQLINGTFHYCQMTSWVLSAHLPVQKTKSSLPNHNEQIIDLVSGEAAGILSWVHYFFNKEFDKIEPYISERIRKEIKDKILIPYCERNDYWWMSLDETRSNKSINNWNPWCNFSVLQCFMLIEEDPDVLAKAVYKSMQSVDKFINHTRGDGACEEGPSYWIHAAGKLYDYAQLLHDATGGKVSILNETLIKDMGEYISRTYVGGDNWVVNFADGTARLQLDYSHIFRYGQAVGSSEMTQFAAYLKQKNGGEKFQIVRDIYRILGVLSSSDSLDKETPHHKKTPYTWYRETEFCYITKDNAFLATKGGFNNESHNHNDVGTFTFFLNSIPIFIDAGVGTYVNKTFSSRRYDIWSMQSDYHNLPRINGFSQKYGNEFKAKNTTFNPKTNTFSLDISGAYPSEAGIKNWDRKYTLGKQNLKIEDSFDILNPTAENEINFMTWGDVDLSKDGIVSIDVQGNKAGLHYDSKLFAASIKSIKQDDLRLSNIWGETVYRVSLTAKTIAPKGKYSFIVKY